MVFRINSLVPELWCSNFEASLAFYTGKLGFSVAQRRGKAHHAYLDLQGAQLMLGSWELVGTWESGPLEKPFGRGINLCFHVDDVRQRYEAYLAAGLAPFVELYDVWYWRTDRMDHREEFALLDPDGYLLRFSQVVAHRPVTTSDLAELDRKNW